MFLFLVAISGVGFNYLFKYAFPNRYNNAVITLMYNFIYYYSFCEMYYLKHFKSKIEFRESKYIEYVKNGQVIHAADSVGGQYDFVIYSQNNAKQLMKDVFQPRLCIKSEVSFILFNIVFTNGDATISLRLSGDDYNYYVCGNIIDSKFLWYFLNTHYQLNLTQPLTNYSLNIIDNNINIHKVTYPEYVEINMYGIFVNGPHQEYRTPLETIADIDVDTEEEEEDEPEEEEEEEEEAVELAITETVSIIEESTTIVTTATSIVETETHHTLKRENTEHEHDTDNYDFVKETI